MPGYTRCGPRARWRRWWGAGLAALRALRRPRAPDGIARIYWLLTAFGLSVVGLALALAIAQQNVYLVPGRYLLPALPAVCLLLAGAWQAWLPWPRLRRRAWQALGLGVVLVGWSVPFTILAPTYAPPALQTAVAIDTPVAAVYDTAWSCWGTRAACRPPPAKARGRRCAGGRWPP